MPADPAQRAIAAYLNDAAEDLAAFALLASGGNRFAVYHLHQAAENS